MMSGARLRINEKLTNVDSDHDLELLVSKTIATIDWDYVINRGATIERHESCHDKLNKKCQPKRPMNPFMLWTQAIRRKLSEQYSNIRNAQLSKILGRMWSNMDYELRRPYLEEAERIRVIHKTNYPDYRYQPRRRAKRAAMAKSKRFSGVNNHEIYNECNKGMRQNDNNEATSGHSEDRNGQLSDYRMRKHDSCIKPGPGSLVIHESPRIFERNIGDEVHCAGIKYHQENVSYSEDQNELGCVVYRHREHQEMPIYYSGGFEWDSQLHETGNQGECQNNNAMINQCRCTSENPVQTNVSSLVYSCRCDDRDYHSRSTSGTIQKCNNNQNNVLVMQTPYSVECSDGDYRNQIMVDYQQLAQSNSCRPTNH